MGKYTSINIDACNVHPLADMLRKRCDSQHNIERTLETAYALAARLVSKLGHALTSEWLLSPDDSLEVAKIAARTFGVNPDAAVAAILAPTFLAGVLTYPTIEQHFGLQTAQILVELDKLNCVSSAEQSLIKGSYVEHAGMNDAKVLAILIQVSYIIWLHTTKGNRQLGYVARKDRSQQTLHALKARYIPMLQKMSLYALQSKVSSLWLRYSNSQYNNYNIDIHEDYNVLNMQRKTQLALIMEEVCAVLEGYNIDFTMKARVKSSYSIWTKLKRLQVGIEELYDLSAMRIILTGLSGKSILEEKVACWRVLTILSQLYKPLCHVMRDWISAPKDNSYEALHLAFETLLHGRLEIQIRTERMDYIAEYGKAAHWKYKYTYESAA